MSCSRRASVVTGHSSFGRYPPTRGDIRRTECAILRRTHRTANTKEDAMKAMLLTGFGGTDMLRYGDAPDPVAGPGDVVVDVHAASVNAADYKMRVGGYSSTLKFPHILGRDFSGVVSAVGAGVE